MAFSEMNGLGLGERSGHCLPSPQQGFGAVCCGILTAQLVATSGLYVDFIYLFNFSFEPC